MMTLEELTAFEDANRENFAVAGKFVRRYEAGLPPDRYCAAEDMPKLAKAIRAYWIIMAQQSEAIETLRAEIASAGEDAMSIGEPVYRNETGPGLG